MTDELAPEPTDAEILEFAAFAMMCKLFTMVCPYTPTPQAAKATRAAIHRQGLPVPRRSVSR